MPLSPSDWAIRQAAFQFLARSVQQYGELLSWKLLTRGFHYGDEPVVLIGQKGIWKPRILDSVPLSIATAPPRLNEPAPYDDGLDETGMLVYRYRGQDPMHPDNAGLRLAMRDQVPLIYFVGVSKGMYCPMWPVFVVGDDPRCLRFRVSIDDQLAVGGAPTDAASMAGEERRRYITAMTVRRLHQHNFRAQVIRAYRTQCAICHLRHAELLDAAHILPDNHADGQPVVPNGIALCKIHHAAFDSHILGIRPDLRVEIRDDILQEVDGPMLKYGLQAMNNSKIVVPRNRDLQPGAEYIERRYEIFRKAG